MVSMSTTPKPLEVGAAAAAVGGGGGDGGGGGKGKEQQQQVAAVAMGPPMAVPADAAEDARMKVRKPYTITKSRESWTEPEHDKFLEALQLFDRDWKKIEAFVGSKTVIQVWIWGVFQAEPTSHKHNNTVASVLLRQSLFFPLYLLEEGSFDAAIAGSDCVFHTASPFYHNVKDPKAELLDPAVNGTLNVLRSCKKASIKRVIVTSSMAAVAYNGKPRTPDVVVDETWFSDAEICEKNQQWYVLSKTLAEEAAWKFANDNGLEIITINPTMVIGPLLQPTLNTSVEAILKFINGNYCILNGIDSWLHEMTHVYDSRDKVKKKKKRLLED